MMFYNAIKNIPTNGVARPRPTDASTSSSAPTSSGASTSSAGTFTPTTGSGPIFTPFNEVNSGRLYEALELGSTWVNDGCDKFISMVAGKLGYRGENRLWAEAAPIRAVSITPPTASAPASTKRITTERDGAASTTTVVTYTPKIWSTNPDTTAFDIPMQQDEKQNGKLTNVFVMAVIEAYTSVAISSNIQDLCIHELIGNTAQINIQSWFVNFTAALISRSITTGDDRGQYAQKSFVLLEAPHKIGGWFVYLKRDASGRLVFNPPSSITTDGILTGTDTTSTHATIPSQPQQPLPPPLLPPQQSHQQQLFDYNRWSGIAYDVLRAHGQTLPCRYVHN